MLIEFLIGVTLIYFGYLMFDFWPRRVMLLYPEWYDYPLRQMHGKDIENICKAGNLEECKKLFEYFWSQEVMLISQAITVSNYIDRQTRLRQ